LKVQHQHPAHRDGSVQRFGSFRCPETRIAAAFSEIQLKSKRPLKPDLCESGHNGFILANERRNEVNLNRRCKQQQITYISGQNDEAFGLLRSIRVRSGAADYNKISQEVAPGQPWNVVRLEMMSRPKNQPLLLASELGDRVG